MRFEIGSGAVWLFRTVWTVLVVFLALTARWLSARPSSILVGVALAMTFGWWYTVRWSRSLLGSVDKCTVYVRYGVWRQREALIPLSALRAVEIWTLPLHRVFRLRTVVLRFAGGAMRIPFLSVADARRLCDFLESAERER